MRIKRLRLKNGYKRFYDLTIDLGSNPARIVALVGPNGCGKSSVLDGLLYHEGHYGQTIGAPRSRAHSYHLMDAENLSSHETLGHPNIEVEFIEGSYYQIRDSRRKKGAEQTMFSFRSPYRYNEEVKIDDIRSTDDIRHNSYGASDASSLDSKMEQNYRRLQAMVSRYRDDNDVRPSEALLKILGDLNASIKKCLNLEISSVGSVEANRGTLYFKKADQSKEFEFNVLSAGEKEVVDLLLDLYLRKDDYNDTVFLIDEPELHINTAIQGKLLMEIDRLVGENCQIWLTTHSIGFLRALQTQMKDRVQILQFKSDDKYASEAYTLKPMPVTATAWRELFAVALDDLATLVCPRTIIYCEGRDKPTKDGSERGMDAQVLNGIFAESHPDTLFISSGGNTELDQRSTIAIAILGKVFPDVEILVFKDRDMASGQVVNENDRQVYLKTNPQNHRVMKRFELENYLYDKEVLKAYCVGNGLEFDEAGYDKFVTDIVNDNLKDATGRIKNICGIKGSITSEAFKINLAGYFREDMEAFTELRDCIFERV